MADITTRSTGTKKKKILTSTSEVVYSARDGLTDVASFTLQHDTNDSNNCYFNIEGTENACRVCDTGCWNQSGTCIEDDCECECLCDNTVSVTLQFTIDQAVDMVKTLRNMFEATEHPQLHVIEEDAHVVLTAGAA